MILDCGHEPSPHSDFTTGYGTNSTTGQTACYKCCAKRDQESMIETGHSKNLPLYYQEDKGEVTNWCGSLRFGVYHARKGYHNMAGGRTDIWFTGPDGKVWHGYQLGQYTQIVHCKRTKK